MDCMMFALEKKSTAHALGGINGVAYVIYADEQVQ